jgi:ribonuclease G
VVIDVNSGKRAGRGDLQKSIIKVKTAAAIEIAKQLRLRNLSGIIIVDFIDMDDQASKQELLTKLRDALACDAAKPIVHGITNLGLIEITRRRTRGDDIR